MARANNPHREAPRPDRLVRIDERIAPWPLREASGWIAFNVCYVGSAMLPPNVQALIARAIHSSAALELLFLLYRSPETYWTASAAAAALGATEERMSGALKSLERHGLVEQARATVAFRYAPQDDEDGQAVELLASAYEHQRVAVLDAVYVAGTGSLEAFAEAFRIRPR